MDEELARKIKEENKKLHNFSGHNFDNYPPHLKKTVDEIFFNDTKKIKEIIKIKNPSSLDCGCGTGYLALNLVKNGFKVDVIDISEEMIGITKKKIMEKFPDNQDTEYIIEDIDKYLTETTKKYDLICFSAVLHHIGDYFRTLEFASKKLNDGGIIYVADEPQLSRRRKHAGHRLVETLSSASIMGYRAFKNPKHALNFVSNRLFKKGSAKIDVGMAEFHAGTGLDDENIVEFFNKNKFTILNFETYIVQPFKIFKITEGLYAGYPKTFKLIAQKAWRAREDRDCMNNFEKK